MQTFTDLSDWKKAVNQKGLCFCDDALIAFKLVGFEFLGEYGQWNEFEGVLFASPQEYQAWLDSQK